MMRGENNSNQKRRIVYLVLVIIFLVVFLVSAGILIYKFVKDRQGQQKFDDLVEQAVKMEPEPEEEKPEPEPEEMPEPEAETQVVIPDLELDWEALTETCEDIYAWIYIPNTNVNYPILQHPDEADYYLRRDYDGNYSEPGCIYTQNINAKDFTDRNTVVYGHNMNNGTMFRTLHNFEDDEFFAENRYIYIYTPEKAYAYEIYAACEFNNFLLSFLYDFESEEGTNQYLQDLRDYGGEVNNFYEDMEVSAEDYFLTLSTCVYGKKELRYLVVGALAAEQPIGDGDEQPTNEEDQPLENGEAQGN